MKNRAHSESFNKRLKRFQDNSPVEIIETLLNSIANCFNNEIILTVEKDNHQTSLLFLGIHAVALTISEDLLDKRGPEGYKLFLERFIDRDTDDRKFSKIAGPIHNWRNVLAHQWISRSGHEIGYDYEMDLGWKKQDGIVFINPKMYCEDYLKAFKSNGRIWEYRSFLSDSDLEGVKSRMVEKYAKKRTKYDFETQ